MTRHSSSESFAPTVKHFLTLHRCGILSTHSASLSGYPFGSITPFLVEDSGSIVIYISLISEHYKNLAANGRASLTVADPFGFEDPQAHARATVLLDFKEIPREELSQVQEKFSLRFPGSVKHEIAHNFLFMRGVVHKIRWIAGFGSMGWVSGEEFGGAAVDKIVAQGFDIISHMNADHRDALVELAAKVTGQKMLSSLVLMTDINANEFVITVSGKAPRKIVCKFADPVTNAEEARAAMVSLIKEARSV
jgi:putative heme iron utilization protein